MAIIQHKTHRIIAELSSTSTTAKRLTVTSWNGRPAKLDLRAWRIDEGEPLPKKGITLTDAEAQALADALQAYLNGEPAAGQE